MTDHPLDNPLWNALSGYLAQHSRAFDGVRLLDPDFGTVAAVQRVTPANVSALASALPYGSQIVAIAPEPISPTADLEVVQVKPLLQMVAEHLIAFESSVDVAELSATDFSSMLALVEITRPGPLGRRAMELGVFRGIYDGEKLVALAGERLHLNGYTELATVCTHPDYRGRNYGKAVVSAVAQGVIARGQTPFLGVNADNTPAIRLYERLGFTHRRMLYLNTVRRPLPASET